MGETHWSIFGPVKLFHGRLFESLSRYACMESDYLWMAVWPLDLPHLFLLLQEAGTASHLEITRWY